MEMLFPDSALRHLEPQPGGYWSVQGRNGDTVLLSYATRDGIHYSTTVKSCQNELEVQKHCGSLIYDLPNAPHNFSSPQVYGIPMEKSPMRQMESLSVQLVIPPQGHQQFEHNTTPGDYSASIHPTGGFVALRATETAERREQDSLMSQEPQANTAPNLGSYESFNNFYGEEKQPLLQNPQELNWNTENMVPGAVMMGQPINMETDEQPLFNPNVHPETSTEGDLRSQWDTVFYDI